MPLDEAGFSKLSLPKVATLLYSSGDTESECSSVLPRVQRRGTLAVGCHWNPGHLLGLESRCLSVRPPDLLDRFVRSKGNRLLPRGEEVILEAEQPPFCWRFGWQVPPCLPGTPCMGPQGCASLDCTLSATNRPSSSAILSDVVADIMVSPAFQIHTQVLSPVSWNVAVFGESSLQKYLIFYFLFKQVPHPACSPMRGLIS